MHVHVHFFMGTTGISSTTQQIGFNKFNEAALFEPNDEWQAISKGFAILMR